MNLPGLTDSFASHLASFKDWCQAEFVEALLDLVSSPFLQIGVQVKGELTVLA
jgi:hypothetical protein